MIHKRHVKRVAFIIIASVLAILLFSYIVIQLNKQNIRNAVTQLLSGEFHSIVTVGSMDVSLFQNFPHLSIEFRNVSVEDSASVNNHSLPDVFTCEDFSCSVALFPLFAKKVQIKTIILTGANINLIKTHSGYSNFQSFQKTSSPAGTSTSGSASTFKNGKVLLQDVHFLLSDSTKNKSFDFTMHRVDAEVSSPDSISHIDCSGTITCGGLGFNLAQGSYLSNQDLILSSQLDWNPSAKKLSVNSAAIQIAPFELNISGSFILGNANSFYLHISDNKITLNKTRELLTQHLSSKLAIYKFSDFLHVEAVIHGSLSAGKQPFVDLVLTSNHTGNLTIQKRFFTDAYVHGIYCNHIDPSKESGDQNSALIFPFFSGQLAGEIPMTLKLRLNDLSNPVAMVDGSSDVSLDSLNDIVDTAHFQFIDGNVHTRFQLFCPVNEFVDTADKVLRAELSGSMVLKNGNLWMPENQYRFENMEGSLFFNSSDVHTDSLHVRWNDNPIVCSIHISDIMPAIFIAKTKTHATADVSCNSFDVKKIISPETPAEKRVKKIRKAQANERKLQDSLPSTDSTAAYWDKLVYNMIVDMNLQAHRVEYKNFHALNLDAHVQFQPDGIQLQKADLQTAGGSLQMQVFVADPTAKKHHISLDCNIYKVAVDDLLHDCDNFGQDVITQKNIRGTLSAHISWQSDFKQDYEVIPSSMRGQMIWTIENGQLMDLQSLQAASKYFPNRDFSNISFERMQDTVTMQGQNFTLSRMHVNSSVLSFYAGGIYSFEGNTNLKVQFPLSNLKAPSTSASDSSKHRAETTINFHLVNKDGKNILLFDGFTVHKKK